ncbi:MAG: hypothetical protein AVDCRST_MAG52-3117, partial [uncultured Blastococcus sp.]
GRSARPRPAARPLDRAWSASVTARSGGAHRGAPGWNCSDCRNCARRCADLRGLRELL